ncbi:MAG TPA: hypothetical protein VH597_15665 [Verrucomicrobiae bacterium]|jgi:hypothetical protein|nr:hypothetical protein [Verrucomicrobiae bacterium]
MDSNLRGLIKDYLKFARDASRIISEQAHTSDIIRAANNGHLPREGAFLGYGGGTYFIHGAGCEVRAAELEIDFDFGPESQIPGFDPWKLYDFAKNHASAYAWLPERENFNRLIEGYLEKKFLKRSNSLPSPHLLCM